MLFSFVGIPAGVTFFLFAGKAKKEEASARSPVDLRFEEMQQYANHLDTQVRDNDVNFKIGVSRNNVSWRGEGGNGAWGLAES